MATAHFDPQTTLDRFTDAIGRAAEVGHEARVLKAKAADAIEEGVDAATRVVTRGERVFNSFRETAADRIKKAPFLMVAIAAGAGLLVGAGCARWGRRASSREW